MMGVETLNPNVFKTLNRGGTVERVETALEALQDAAISVQATVILGIPGDSLDSMQFTLDRLNSRCKGRDIIGACYFTPFAPLEKTMSHLDYEIVIKDRDFYSGYMPVTSSKSCSYEKLWDLFLDMGHSRIGKYDRIGHFSDSRKVLDQIAGG
jgi:radical SAM superfamily enzyme YgiQ (UPF0313 family)